MGRNRGKTCRYCCGEPNPVHPDCGKKCRECHLQIEAYRIRAGVILADPPPQSARAERPLVTDHTRERRGL